jgi:hypothetical protein
MLIYMRMRRNAGRALALAALLGLALASPRQATAKDFPESIRAADPLAAIGDRDEGDAGGFTAPAGLGGAFEYGNYFLAHDDADSFFLRASLNPIFFRAGEDFALGGLYETDLLCGPVGEGQTAANIAAFWMNAVQFEYGLYASARVSRELGLHLLAEYSRSSQHPLRSDNYYSYSEVTADILSLGLCIPRLELGPVSAGSSLRLGYRDLFGFWKSSLPLPRVSWFARAALEAKLPLKNGLILVGRAYPDLFVDRYGNKLDADFLVELGIALARGELDDELLLTCYGTRDSELLDDRAHPTFEAGVLFRFAVSRL